MHLSTYHGIISSLGSEGAISIIIATISSSYQSKLASTTCSEQSESSIMTSDSITFVNSFKQPSPPPLDSSSIGLSSNSLSTASSNSMTSNSSNLSIKIRFWDSDSEPEAIIS
ncbi:hypothetical protein LguiB_001937 [Lonicera macranthoides]